MEDLAGETVRTREGFQIECIIIIVDKFQYNIACIGTLEEDSCNENVLAQCV